MITGHHSLRMTTIQSELALGGKLVNNKTRMLEWSPIVLVTGLDVEQLNLFEAYRTSGVLSNLLQLVVSGPAMQLGDATYWLIKYFGARLTFLLDCFVIIVWFVLEWTLPFPLVEDDPHTGDCKFLYGGSAWGRPLSPVPIQQDQHNVQMISKYSTFYSNFEDRFMAA